jgi:A/G-specific adenine glycosylase
MAKQRLTSSDRRPTAFPFSTLRRRLLHWFAGHQRDLPWRHNRDPYRIWLSEVLLQQTQVATVIPYFERFIAAFPTVTELAAADEQQVLRLWEGLGYYSRARNLHRAARQIVMQHAGRFPSNSEQCAALPGIGRYMVGAILSQAFEQRLPIVEANSQRVLCRLFGQRRNPRTGPVQKWLWRQAEVILPRRKVGAFNQAMMELGALVCTAKAPRCSACPLTKICLAHRLRLQAKIPASSAPLRTVDVQEVAVVVRRGQRVLLVQRPNSGRWAGMWEFPHGTVAKGESHDKAAGRLVQELIGLKIGSLEELLTVRHGVTRFRITMICFEARRLSGMFRSEFYLQGRWLSPDDLGAYPVSAPQRKLANYISSGVRQRRLF